MAEKKLIFKLKKQEEKHLEEKPLTPEVVPTIIIKGAKIHIEEIMLK